MGIVPTVAPQAPIMAAPLGGSIRMQVAPQAPVYAPQPVVVPYQRIEAAYRTGTLSTFPSAPSIVAPAIAPQAILPLGSTYGASPIMPMGGSFAGPVPMGGSLGGSMSFMAAAP